MQHQRSTTFGWRGARSLASRRKRIPSVAAVRLRECLEALLALAAGVWFQGGALKLGKLRNTLGIKRRCAGLEERLPASSVVEARLKFREKEAQRRVLIFHVLIADAAVDVRIAGRGAAVLALAHDRLRDLRPAARGGHGVVLLVDEVHDGV